MQLTSRRQIYVYDPDAPKVGQAMQGPVSHGNLW
jgi:hypothetical protein